MSDLHTELELARALFGPQSSDGLGVRRVTATATSDSSGGTVAVDVGGEVVEVPVIGAVSTGDEVQLLVDNGAPIAVAATGWGDQLQATATSAEAIATAVNQHVWTDTSGVHVTEQDQDASTGATVLLNSQGLLLRDGTDDLAAFASGGVEFYDGGATTASFNGSGAVIGDPDGTHVELDADSMSVEHTTRGLKFVVDTADQYGNIVKLYNGSSAVFGIGSDGMIHGDKYAVTQGTHSGNTWVTERRGRLIEATCKITGSLAVTTSYGGRYISALQTVALPSGLFSSLHYVNVTAASSPGIFHVAHTSASTTSVSFYVVANTSLTQNVNRYIIVRGV